MWILNVVAGICVAISFMGAGLEIGRLFGSKAFEWSGGRAGFLIPAGLPHFAAWYADLAGIWGSIARSCTSV